MYLNDNREKAKNIAEKGLTVTLDVFKFSIHLKNNCTLAWLTVTLDVFKS